MKLIKYLKNFSIFEVEGDRLIILILRIGRRKDIYKGLEL